MKTVLEILNAMKEYFHRKNLEPSRRLAEEVLSAALATNRMQLYLQFDRPLNEEELEKCRSLMQRRAKGEPIQYIAGEVDFYHCSFLVTRDVLIPRPETEQLVDKIVGEIKGDDLSGKVLWDMCAGSGCIGISLKKRFPSLSVVLADCSAKALLLAQENGKRNGVEVACVEGDLFAPLLGRKCHYFVSNPPYVDPVEYARLQSEVRDFEPPGALLAGPGGLDFYRRFSQELKNYLYPGAKVWMEIGFDQGEAVKNLFLGAPWRGQKVERDYSGNDRFFSLEIE